MKPPVTDRFPGIRPRPSLWRRLDMAARVSFPATTSALLLLATAAPVGLPGQPEMQAPVALACVVFWSLYRPGSMPPVVVFALGFLADLLGYGPLGVFMVVLLVVHGVTSRLRRVLVRGGFATVWLAFGAVVVAAAGLQWALTCLMRLTLLPPEPVVLQSAFGIGLYPPLSLLLSRTHDSLAAPEQA